jgi:hypothetical protein
VTKGDRSLRNWDGVYDQEWRAGQRYTVWVEGTVVGFYDDEKEATRIYQNTKDRLAKNRQPVPSPKVFNHTLTIADMAEAEGTYGND